MDVVLGAVADVAVRAWVFSHTVVVGLEEVGVTTEELADNGLLVSTVRRDRVATRLFLPRHRQRW